MVTHKRESMAPGGALCSNRAEGDLLADTMGIVDCAGCLSLWRRMEEAAARGYSFPSLSDWLPMPKPSTPALQRSDDSLMALLARARAQGVRTLEVRPDGSFVAVMDPAPVEAPARQPEPGLSPKDEAEQREAEQYARNLQR